MKTKPRFLEVNYYHHREFSSPGEVIDRHLPSNLFASHLTDKADIILVKHLEHEGMCEVNQIRYRFFRSRNSFFHIPSATHRYISEQKPDYLLVQGLIFPLQVIALARRLGNKTKIILQHQGEVPFHRKRILQKIADRYVSAYIFTSLGNADEWIEGGVIRDHKKCREINPSSTLFSRKSKTICRQELQMTAPVNFLWVGRLNANKDPLTVLSAFEKYFRHQPCHKLYMIYSEVDLLQEVNNMIEQHTSLTNNVVLVGKTAHQDLEKWYSAADYFVSGSHREGGSYALTEAMACGCVPIVTTIPSAMKTINDGQAGYYFAPGNAEELFSLLTELSPEPNPVLSCLVEKHFQNHLSPASIADKIWSVCTGL